MSAWILWRSAEYLTTETRYQARKTLIFVHRTVPMLLIRIFQNNYLFFRESSNRGRWVSDHAHRLRLRYSMPYSIQSSPKRFSRRQYWEAELEEEDWLRYLTVPPIGVHGTWQAASKAAHFCKGHFEGRRQTTENWQKANLAPVFRQKLGTAWNSARTKALSCTWEGIHNTGWALLGSSQWKTLVCMELNVSKGQQFPGLVSRTVASRQKGQLPSTVLIRPHPEYHKPHPQIQETQQKTKANFSRGFQNWLGSGAPDL